MATEEKASEMRAAHLTTPLLAEDSTRTSLGNSGLNAVGVDVFRDIVACLSGPEVAKLSCVSRGWKDACDDKRLWGYLYGRAFTTSHKPPVIGARHPKQMFQARYDRHKSRTANRIRERRERVQRYHAEMGQARCIRCAGVFQGLAAVGLPCILILVFIVMLGLYLDGETSASFTGVMAFLYAMCGLSVLSTMVFCCSLWASEHADARCRVCVPVWRDLSEFPGRIMLKELFASELSAFVHGGVLATVLILQLVMINLQVSGVVDTSWAIVFIPFFLSLCLFACAPAAGWCFKDEKPFFAFLCALLTCIILPVIIMLALIGDGVHILLELALIPLWIAFGVLLIVGLCAYCFNLRAMRRRGDSVKGLCALFAGILFFSPWALTAIFTTLKVGDVASMSWMSVLTPLIVWFAAAAVVGVAMAIALTAAACSKAQNKQRTAERTLANVV